MRYPQGDHCELRRPRSGSGTMREGRRGGTARLQRTLYRGRCVPPLPSQLRKKTKQNTKTTKPTNPYKSAQDYQQHALEPSSSRDQPTGPHLTVPVLLLLLPLVLREGGADSGCPFPQLPAASFLSAFLCPQVRPSCQQSVNTDPESLPAPNTAPSLSITT